MSRNPERDAYQKTIDRIVTGLEADLQALTISHNDLMAAHNLLVSNFNDAVSNSRGLRERVTRLENELADVKGRVSAAATEVSGLRAKATSVDSQLAGMSEKVGNAVGLVAAQHHPGRRTESDYQHHDVAADYLAFLEQDLDPLVNAAGPDGHRPGIRRRAELLSELTRVLFESAEPSAEALQAVLGATGAHDVGPEEIIRIVGLAQSIRDRAKVLGRQQRWDFGGVGGRYVAGQQERVAGSGPGDLVEIVVAPAYLIGDGLTAARKQVFTS